jgi:sigma-B regulation protein RsbU (phosphoserine phosphatase)
MDAQGVKASGQQFSSPKTGAVPEAIRVRDLIQAGEIQKHLLEKSRVNDKRFQVLLYNKMAHELGGDFYRVFRSGDDRYLVGCFDVAGKNISGSLATMALGACFSALELLTFQGCPEEITRFINSLVRDVSPPGLFITAVLFYVDFTSLSVMIHNCGFSPVLVFVPREKQRIAYKVIQPALPPLGIQEELDLDTGQIVPISPGLRLTAYSDGLTDMTNIRRERYGEEKTFGLLKKFQSLPQDRIREVLEQEIAAWVGEAQGAVSLADDVTLVDMRFM